MQKSDIGGSTNSSLNLARRGSMSQGVPCAQARRGSMSQWCTLCPKIMDERSWEVTQYQVDVFASLQEQELQKAGGSQGVQVQFVLIVGSCLSEGLLVGKRYFLYSEW